MNPYQIATLKELLLVTTFLSLAAAAYARGGELEMKLALATCGTCIYFVSLHAKPTFRAAYLLTFANLLTVWLVERACGLPILRAVFKTFDAAIYEYGDWHYDNFLFYQERFYIFLAFVLVSLPYLVARLCVAIWQPKETIEPPVSN